MSEPKNIKEFQALVERYETITLEEITSKWSYTGCITATILTGYHRYTTCTLCMKVIKEFSNKGCIKCIYKTELGCTTGENKKTYFIINSAKTAKQLLNAFRARAEHLRKTYPQYL